jgi:predicted MPP superfamily phosphohydrolase
MRNYSVVQRLWEAAQRTIAPVPWPAHVASWLGVNTNVAVEHHAIHVAAGLGGATQLRIAFASDFHAGPTTPQRMLDHAVLQLTQANADVLLLGGDFVSLRSDNVRRLARQLAAVPAPLGRYAVLGNHDYWAGAGTVLRHLQDAGIAMLTNSNVRLPGPFQNVTICGIDDHTSGEPDAEAAFSGSSGLRIVLMHGPSGLLDIGSRRFDVALCGHTHGGQIALANGRSLIAGHGRLSRRYSAGRFAIAPEQTLLVSRGVGYGVLPVRINAPAAVMTCTIFGKPEVSSGG